MKKLIYIIILIWALIAGSVTAYNEIILSRGKEILLKVMPVDPRDFLRGDYVTLRYDINTFKRNNDLHGNVYVVLGKNPEETYGIERITYQKPKTEIFLKGEKYGKRIDYKSIQQYFVQEGEGRKLEKQLAKGGLARISVDKNGNARIKEIIVSE